MSQERIWAPWRLEFIQGHVPPNEIANPENLLPGADPDCFLCQAVASNQDRQRLVVARGELTLTVLNRYPYNNGHLLVSPRRHVGHLAELTPAEHLELAMVVTRMVGRLEELLGAKDFNVGLNLGLLPEPDFPATCTGISFRDGMATRTSCLLLQVFASSPNRWILSGS